VASIPLDQSSSSARGNRPPVSAHPAFPAVVALWFAALLGLGSLILPVQLIERLLGATGIAALVPAAAPPLGFTSRAAIALAATILGALVGLMTARRLAFAASRRLTDARDAAASRTNDQADDGDDDYPDDDLPPLHETSATPEPPATPGRRRPLALAEDDRPSDFLRVVPLPGDVSREDAGDYAGEEFGALVLGPEFQAADSDVEPMPDAPAPPIEITRSEPSSVTALDPLLFSPPSLARGDDGAQTAPEMAQADVARPEIAEPPISAPENDVRTNSQSPRFAPVAPVASTLAGSEAEGLVQLVQKLGRTLEKHREWSAQRAAARPEEIAAAEPSQRELAEKFEPAPAADAEQAMAAWFGSTPQPDPEPLPESALPASHSYAPFAGMGRLALVDEGICDEEEADDEIDQLAASFRLPAGGELPAPPVRDAAYGSLGADNPFRRADGEFVRIEEPDPAPEDPRPAVLFPNQQGLRQQATAPVADPRPTDRHFDPPGSAPAPAPAPAAATASNDDNERALREALMNLQRMGG